jgi:hypothetical protein
MTVEPQNRSDPHNNADPPIPVSTMTASYREGANESPPNPADVARQLLERTKKEEPMGPQLQTLAKTTHRDLSRVRTDRRTGLAFWLNVYNMATQRLLESRPELFDSRVRFFRAHAITVAGVSLTLDDVEHGIIRGGRSKYGLGYLPRIARTGLGASYRLKLDPRVHFALNCGAVSCLTIRAYEPNTVAETLDDATTNYLKGAVEYDPEHDRVRLPRICLWYIGDFGGQSGIIELLRRFELILPGASPSLRFHSYNWTTAPRAFADSER